MSLRLAGWLACSETRERDQDKGDVVGVGDFVKVFVEKGVGNGKVTVGRVEMVDAGEVGKGLVMLNVWEKGKDRVWAATTFKLDKVEGKGVEKILVRAEGEEGGCLGGDVQVMKIYKEG